MKSIPVILSENQFLKIRYYGGPQVEVHLIEVMQTPEGLFVRPGPMGVMTNRTFTEDRERNARILEDTINSLRRALKNLTFGIKYGRPYGGL